MSIQAVSEQDHLPAQSSYHNNNDDINQEGWKKNIRGCVTALKCHILASKGLTPEGFITKPYSPDVLLKNNNNAFHLEDIDKKDLENYISTAMAKLSHNDTVKTDDNLEDNQIDVVDSGSVKTVSNSSHEGDDNKTPNDTSFCTVDAESPKVDIESSMCSQEDSQQMKDIKDELTKKSGEIEKLSKIRDDVENELQDLTANLFQEAHSMVQLANQRAAAAEKSEREAKMQVEMLQAEVVALKALVITSTPSAPNPHLHPHIISKGAQMAVAEAGKIFQRGHKKSPSDFDLKYGRDTTPPSSPLKEGRLMDSSVPNAGFPLDTECWEVDPVLHREFVSWRQDPDLGRSHPFMTRVYIEDIDLCLAFPNSALAQKLHNAIEQNTLFIEEVNPRQKSSCPKKCVLLDVPRYCKYRFRLGDVDDTWFYICQLARNRIISVCDFLCYLRYIQRGLVKSSIHDVYWEIVKLRHQMALARLGF